MKHLLHSLALRVTMLIALLVSFGSSGAWADGTTATINFGSTTGYTNVNTSPKTGDDSQGNTWTITTVGTTSYSPNASYAQIGSKNSPATSITFTTTLSEDVNITAFSAKFGGFSGTAGTVTLKVGDTSVGTGSLSTTSDVTVSASESEVGKVLTVTVTGISKGVKAYYISYTYEAVSSTKDVGAFSAIADQAVTKGSNISFNPATYFTPDGDLTADATLTVTPTTGDIYYSEGKIYATNYGSQVFTVTATPAIADAEDYNEVETTFTVNCEDTRTATTTAINTSAINNNVFVGTDGGSVTATVTPEGGVALVTPTILWSSSNTSVATIDETTGAITLVAAGSTTITATYSGDASYKPSSDTYELTVVSVDPTIRTVWSEDFGGSYSANATTYSYSLTSSEVASDDNYAGGTAPEMMIRMSTGVYTSTIPLNGDYIGNMTLSFKSNANPIEVSTTTTGVSISGTYSFSTLGTHSVTFTGITTSTTSLLIKFTNKSSNKNVRLDDIVLKGKPAPTAPSFSSVAGDILKGSTVTLTADEGCTIYYTTDGTTPTDASTEYTGAITINAAQTIKAIAVDANDVSSKVVSATYTLLKPEVPEFSVAAKSFDKAFDMTISSASGTTLKYTTDGTDPSSSGAATAVASNSTTINIPTGADVTVKAIAILDGVESNVAEVTYDYDDRPAPTFTLSDDELNIKVNEASSVTLTTTSDGTVTAASSDGIHLPVSYNSSTKVCSFTPSLAGDYTITISVPATENYLAAEASVVVHVTKKATTMEIETDFSNGKDLYTADEGLIGGTVKYNDVALTPQPTISYTSSNTSVATVAADGTITYVSAGSTTITVAYAGNEEYEASQNTYELTLYDTTPQEMSVSISFNNALFGTSFNGSAAGITNDNPCVGVVKNVTVTYAGSGNHYINNNAIRLYENNVFTIAAPTGYVITQIVLTGESGFSDGLTNPNASATWTGSNSTVSITGETKSGGTRKNLTGATVTLAEVFTVGSAGYTTYVTKHAVSFPSGVKAYIVTDKDSETLTLTETASAPKNTPLILKADADTYKLTVIDDEDAADVTGNMLHAAELDGSTKGDGSTIYALGVGKDGALKNKVGFFLVGDGVTVPAGKAYLEVDGSGDLQVKEFLGFSFGDETSITEHSEQTEGTESLFDLSGRRVSKAQKGLYIVNGKKVLVK